MTLAAKEGREQRGNRSDSDCNGDSDGDGNGNGNSDDNSGSNDDSGSDSDSSTRGISKDVHNQTREVQDLYRDICARFIMAMLDHS